jgi:ornithine cyclodeaminase/alanine dehydrogenase-like protein (mu-crystallin family)
VVRILSDHDIDRVPFSIILEAVRTHVLSDFRGETVSPPRHAAEFGDGGIVFTVGGNADVAGFRAYETFATPALEKEDQLIAVWDRATRRLSGISVGERMGALRTGALGGVAIDRMAPEKVSKLAVIGAGVQAETQIVAACSVRSFDEIAVYSRGEEKRETFAARMKALLKTNVLASGSAERAVSDADVVILATSSCIPVIEFGWLKLGVHVNTVGPKTRAAHELPLEVARFAVRIATDSPQQIGALGDEHMLAGTDAAGRIQHLGDPASQQSGKGTNSLFLSAGLAGSEVAALKGVLDWLEGNEVG